ncbi:hypothetical protein MWU75_00555 [Ornithinimicrobium sp. F0845]|uniref:hypothetical protein n=1 Tax=Ornithinimicrobium sp. F0845 TaxID=2926412 RepID=UPI001FF2878A|nr:hypothetical protein [Ornithinimicrobium sp. F0845]MCK0110636.1 hypothetical protein [Ornithinimicrobium sp. F0845]
MTGTDQDLQRVQRRGRLVIATIIALFVLVCVALGVFLWQRQQQENRLAELTKTGLLAVGLPPLTFEIDEVSALENNRGLVTTYRYADGEPVSQFRLLNLRVGTGQDPCEVLTRVEPALGDRCEVSGSSLSAVANGPSTILHAEGQVHAATLVVLVGHPATFDDQTLRAFVDAAELVSIRELLAQAG